MIELQRYDEAIEACEQAIQLDPAYTTAYSYQAKALKQQRKKRTR